MPLSAIDANPSRRAQSRAEVLADACIHAISVVAALAGSAVLIVAAMRHSGAGATAAICVYSLGMIAMFSASAAYNLLYASRWRALLRRCDHAAIFLMIAGTYTPFTTQWHTGVYAILLTGGIWATAGTGIALKIFAPAIFERIAVVLYLGLGWTSIVVLAPLAGDIAWSTLIAILVGGALYSVGVLFHRWDSLKFQNAIWHVFVACAATTHYVAVLGGVVFATS